MMKVSRVYSYMHFAHQPDVLKVYDECDNLTMNCCDSFLGIPTLT